MPSRARVSSPTRRSVSGARRARSRARSGTATPATAIWSCSAPPTTTPARWERAPGAMSRSSSRARTGSSRHANPAGRWWISACRRCAVVGIRRRCAPARSDRRTPPDTPEFRWLMASDVCKHCTHAGCLDVCPTGALFRTEFGTVVVQDDVCNGCGTCVAGARSGWWSGAATAPRVRERPSGAQCGLESRCGPESRCRAEVHAVLRPPRRRPDPGLREDLPDDVDQVRRPRRTRRAGPRTRGATARPGAHRGPAVRGQRARRRRWHRVDLPAARRTGGVRVTAGPAGTHGRPYADVQARAGVAGLGMFAAAAVAFWKGRS